jgi:protein disulfide-isomerase A6
VTNSQIPTIVRFYTSHRQGSLALDEQYELVCEMFEGIDGITVAGINCGKFRHFCYANGVAQTPLVRLYSQDAVHLYDGGMSHESISRWVTGLTGVHPRELVQSLRKPNGRVYKELLNSTHCVFTMFYNPWCVAGKRFLPHIQEVAEAFKYDDRVEFCANDVDLYKFFNWDFDLRMLPDLRLYCKDEAEPVQFTGRRTSEDLIDFINDYCGTQRGLNGRLNSEAGLVDEVSQIVEDFLTKGKKPHYISDMEQVEGTKYYVWVMNEVMQKGDGFIQQEKNRLNGLLDSGTLAPDKLDEFQIRVNILGVFSSYLEGTD